MATNTYRFDGDKRQGYHTDKFITDDADGIRREVKRTETIDLTDAQVANLRQMFNLSLTTDPPVANAVKTPMDILGTPAQGDVVEWSESDEAWIPHAASGVAEFSSPLLGCSGQSTENINDFITFNTLIAPRALDMALFFSGFPNTVMFGAWNTLCNQLNMMPHVTWSSGGPLSVVTDNSQDTALAGAVTSVVSYGKPVVIRMCHEFNGPWTPYGYKTDGSGDDPAEFIAGWKHVVEYFRDHNVTNVLWCWGPNIWRQGQATAVDPRDYYPGDDYVDVIALDGYMTNKDPLPVLTFADLFVEDHKSLRAMAPSKPFMIGEVGAAEDARFSKSQWIIDMFDVIRREMPDLWALNWWERDATGVGEGNYQIDSSAGAKSAFQRAVTAAPFLPRSGNARLSRPHAPDFSANGIIVPNSGLFGGSLTSSFALTAQRMYWARFVAPRDMKITLAAIATQVAAATDDPLEIAIFSSDLATRIAYSGVVNGKLNAAPGVQTVPLSALLAGGTTYYAALLCAAIGGAPAQVNANNVAGLADLFGTGLPARTQWNASGVAVMPAAGAAPSGAGSVSTPIIALRES